jgi:hypothetical protein
LFCFLGVGIETVAVFASLKDVLAEGMLIEECGGHLGVVSAQPDRLKLLKDRDWSALV